MCIRDSYWIRPEQEGSIEAFDALIPAFALDAVTSNRNEQDPVSYTHLDVYKRQRQDSIRWGYPASAAERQASRSTSMATV